MNYQGIYDHIIANAKVRSISKEEYTERHHIIPKSLGGSNRKENIVRLYPREHFVCHVLLHKIHGGKMTYTLYMMSNRKEYNTSRLYERVRHDALKTLQNPDRREKISNSLKGRKKSGSHIASWKESRKNGAGWVCSEDRKLKLQIEMSGNNNPMFGRCHSEEAVKKISEANRQKIICPHCEKEGGIAIMKRWHFDRCKSKPVE